MQKSKKIQLNLLIFSLICVTLAINFFMYAFLKIDSFKNVFRYISVLLIVILFILNRKIVKNEILMLIVIVVLLIQNNEVSINLGYLLLLALSAKFIENKRLYKIINILNTLIIVCVVICLLTGIVKNEVIYSRNRNTLGFSHVNYVGLLCYSISSIYMLYKDKLTKMQALVIFVLAFVILKISDSRTGCYATFIVIIIYYLLKLMKLRLKKFICWLYSAIIFSIPALIKLPIFTTTRINNMLSNRPIIYSNFVNSSTIKNLFIGGMSATTDCFYINALFGCGIFIYILLFVIFTRSITSKLNNHKNIEVSFILTTMLIGTMESSIMRPELLCILVFWKLIIEEIYNSGTKNNE